MKKEYRITCSTCGKAILGNKAAWAISRIRRGEQSKCYCSKACYIRNNLADRVERKCFRCGKVFLLLKSRAVKRDRSFCSRSCFASVANAERRKIRNCINCQAQLTRCSQRKFCTHTCEKAYARSSFIKAWLSGTLKVTSEYRSKPIREYLLDKFKHRCSSCGWGEINKTTGKTPLNVEHIDGDCTNNSPKNVTLLCPNCHSLTPTYGALNKGRSRRTKRYKLRP